MADIVYLFGFSFQGSTQFDQVIPLVKSQLIKGMTIDIVLLQDAVIGTNKKDIAPKPFKELMDFAFQMKNVGAVTCIEPVVKLHIFVIKSDYEARGFSPDMLLPNLTLLTYDQFVDKMDEAKKLISWM